ncbi:unnamed protein product, partial [Bubo scandiacus]
DPSVNRAYRLSSSGNSLYGGASWARATSSGSMWVDLGDGSKESGYKLSGGGGQRCNSNTTNNNNNNNSNSDSNEQSKISTNTAGEIIHQLPPRAKQTQGKINLINYKSYQSRCNSNKTNNNKNDNNSNNSNNNEHNKGYTDTA